MGSLDQVQAIHQCVNFLYWDHKDACALPTHTLINHEYPLYIICTFRKKLTIWSMLICMLPSPYRSLILQDTSLQTAACNDVMGYNAATTHHSYILSNLKSYCMSGQVTAFSMNIMNYQHAESPALDSHLDGHLITVGSKTTGTVRQAGLHNKEHMGNLWHRCILAHVKITKKC